MSGARPTSRQDLNKKLKAGTFWVGAFGFLLPHKGIQQLLHAIRILRDIGYTGVRALIMTASLDQRSEESATEISSYIESNDLSDVVAFIPEFLKSEDVLDLLSGMDVVSYTYSETGESASGAVRFGAATGRPLLTTPLPIFDEVASFSFRSKGVDARSIADQIGLMVNDRDYLESRIEDQKRWVEERRWDRIAERLSDIFRGVVADTKLGKARRSRSSFVGESYARPDPRVVARLGVPPTCPAGIRRPFSGRSRPWLARVYRFGPNIRRKAYNLSAQTIEAEVLWSEPHLALIRCNANQVDASLHILDGDRSALSESLLIIDGVALSSISVGHRVSLFLYAIRHGIRTVVEAHSSVEPSSVYLLADAIMIDDMTKASIIAMLEKSQQEIAPPQVWEAEPLDDIISNHTLTLREIILPSSDVITSPIVNALRAICLSAPDIPVVRNADTAGRTLGWRIVHGQQVDSGACKVSYLSGNRTALLLDSKTIERCSLEDLDLRPLIGSVTAIIFDSAADYAAFFDMASRWNASVSMLRRKSYLLEPGPEESKASVVERLARILRQAAPPRLAELGRYLPLLWTPPFEREGPLLSICVSTFNRAAWLRITLPLIARQIPPERNIEFLVVDNTSTDDTPAVLQELAPSLGIRFVRNASNVGMLGNLAVTAKLAKGEYVWILGDDDLILPGTVEKICAAIDRHPTTELVYVNYGYTHFDRPSDLENVDSVIATAVPIAPETPSCFTATIRTFAANNENIFTAIYTCIFRRDHAIAAYTQYTGGPPFSTMSTCIPTTKYVLENMMDRPGYWLGSHQLVVNMNVSWIRFAPVWHMERLIEAFDLAEAMGANPDDLMTYRKSNLEQAKHFMREGFGADIEIRALLNMPRYIESAKHVPEFSLLCNELLARYDQATLGQSVRSDEMATSTLRMIYGL